MSLYCKKCYIILPFARCYIIMKLYDINNEIEVPQLDLKRFKDSFVTDRVDVDIVQAHDKVTNIDNAIVGLSVLYAIIKAMDPSAGPIESYNPVRSHSNLNVMLAVGEYFYDVVNLKKLSVEEMIQENEEYVACFVAMMRYLSTGRDRHVPVLLHEYYANHKFSISAIVAGDLIELQGDKKHTAYWYLIDTIMDSYRFVV